MKKLLISTLAFSALFAVSCQKEIDKRLETTPYTIHATIDQTKTAYSNESAFSWQAGDQVSLEVISESTGEPNWITLSTTESGTSANFTSNDISGWIPGDHAFYPKNQGNNDLTLSVVDNALQLQLKGTIAYDPENPMACIPLIGYRQSGNGFAFKTATGNLRFTVSNIPEDANYLALDADCCLNGYFNIPEDGELSMANALQSWGQKYITFTPSAAGATMDFYLPIPVGTIPAGATLSINSASQGKILLATTSKDIVVERNKVIRIPAVTCPDAPAESWTYLGMAKFIDTFVWEENNFSTGLVGVNMYYDETYGVYKMSNPYAAAAEVNGVSVSGADDEFFFEIDARGRVSHDWLNMGLPLSKNPDALWAMISGQKVAGYGDDFSHVVSCLPDGTPAMLQIAPCYRTADENQSGAPNSYDNEIGKDHNNGIITIVFPNCDYLDQFPIASDHISVSANQSGDGTGAPGLIDNNIATYWHTPWSEVDTNADPVYGQYVTVNLSEYMTTVAFNYCTRNSANQNGAPAIVVVGGSTDGKTYTELGTFEFDWMYSNGAASWVGLPSVDATGYTSLRFGIAKNQGGLDLREITSADQWCNLSELMLYGLGTGQEIAFVPDWLEDGQVWVKEDMIVKASATAAYDGGGIPALVDGNPATYWHTDYYYAVTDNDPEYGICIDIKLEQALQNFHFKFQVRDSNANSSPSHIVYAGSNDGVNWTKLDEEDTGVVKGETPGGTIVTLKNIQAGTAYSYLRFGITDSTDTNQGSLTGDLNFVDYKKCVNMAELCLFAD